MKLYQSNRSFIISKKNDGYYSMIDYLTDYINVSYVDVSYVDVDGDEYKSKSLLAESYDVYTAYTFDDDYTITYHNFNDEPLIFRYDIDCRELVCEFNDNGPKTFRIKYETPLQKWMDLNPGPYTTITVSNLDTFDNPFAELDYVYLDGIYLLCDPMHIEVKVPTDKVEMVLDYAKNNGITVNIW